jgi:hypothetical protein
MSLRQISVLVTLAAVLLVPRLSGAQVFRAYLSGHGVDNPACSLAAPCRLLPAALTAVADGGEIWMLDSANYNGSTVFITKSVTILAIPGALGSVVATGGNAISVDSPGAKVVLRNLVIVPLPDTGAFDGVQVSQAASITIDNCLIAGLPHDGVSVIGNTSVRVIGSTVRGNSYGIHVAGETRTTIVRSIVSGNTNVGIYVVGGVAASNTTADIAESTVDGNMHGVWAFSAVPGGNLSVSVRDSHIVNNTFLGIVSQSQNGGPVMVSATNNLVSANGGTGLNAGAGARMFAAGNLVSGNVYGIFVNSAGTFESAGNNAVRNNSTAQSDGTITVVAGR